MKDYIEQCVALESLNYQEPNVRLLHATLGLVTETAELLNFFCAKNFLEELGDVMWYVAIACDELQVTLDEAHDQGGLLDEDDLLISMVTDAAGIADLFKKSTFYGRELDRRKVVEHLGRIIEAVVLCADEIDKQLDEVMAANLAKLHRRYKDKTFTAEEANHRNTDEEMKVF